MHILWLPLLLGTAIWAEEQHFLQSNPTTWDEARLYCQVCFKELTTITSRNVQFVVQNLTSDYWIGLRRSFNGSIPWSRWSNGDPVTYQNWYPGHPIPKKDLPPCSSTTTSTPMTVPISTPMSYTTAAQNNKTEYQCPLPAEILFCLNMTNGEFENITGPVVNPTPTLYSSPLPVNITSNSTKRMCDPEPDLDPDEYIEDACVVLLSYGMWKEKQCYELLPFICYDERFFGEINISDVSQNESDLYWIKGPGQNISHYRVEVWEWNTRNKTQIFNETQLTTKLVNLTAGTQYRVQVFPVKCGRDLNPQNVSFYTLPIAIDNLTVEFVTTNSIKLRWDHLGNYDFYLIQVSGDSTKQVKTNKTQTEILDLTPGVKYNFTVFAVVNETTQSVPLSISTFTKPSIVLDLKSVNQSYTVINASWNPPNGSHSGYRYCLNESKCINCSGCPCTEFLNSSNTTQQIELTDKTPGVTYFLCVVALTDNNTLAGEMTEIKAFTRPNTVNLSLDAFDKSINARWTLIGSYYNFSLSIEGPGYPRQTKQTNESAYNFTELKAAVKYTVTVITLSEKDELKSDPAVQSMYTKPVAPKNAAASVLNKTAINVTWGAPEESKGANITYEVSYQSWKTNNTMNVTSESVIVASLNSGTRYNFSVSVVADNLKSAPVSASAQTEANKRTLTFAMLCTSKDSLGCNDTVMTETLKQLKEKFKRFDGVHRNLTMINRK